MIITPRTHPFFFKAYGSQDNEDINNINKALLNDGRICVYLRGVKHKVTKDNVNAKEREFEKVMVDLLQAQAFMLPMAIALQGTLEKHLAYPKDLDPKWRKVMQDCLADVNKLTDLILKQEDDSQEEFIGIAYVIQEICAYAFDSVIRKRFLGLINNLKKGK